MSNDQEKKRILIVEDDALLLDSLAEAFTGAGFLVLKAKDGEEGFQQTVDNQPDLILVDILMPKMDGMTMLKNLHNKEPDKKIPTIILTNLNDSETVSKALATGAYDYLVKSDWEPKSLVQMVKEKLNIA